MSILSDTTIRELIESGEIGVDPFDPEMIQPASIDVRSSGHFRVFKNTNYTHIDPRANQPELTEEAVKESDMFVLHPGEFVLGSTMERITLPANITAKLDGKSSLGRLGLVIHSTAGLIDPGFDGTITLELSNQATLPICLYPQMPIGQVSFTLLDRPAEIPYGDPRRKSKYQGQINPTASQMHRNFTDDEDVPTRILPPPPSVPLDQTTAPVDYEGRDAPNKKPTMEYDAACSCTYIGSDNNPGAIQRITKADCVIHGITP